MIRRLFHLAFAVLLAPLFFAFSYEGALFLVSVFTFDSTKWFFLGAALALPVALLSLSYNIAFIEHLLHELEHAVVDFFFTFRLPRRLEVDPEQGSKVYVSTRGGCIVSLAPYYFPILTVLVSSSKPWLLSFFPY